MAGGGKTKDQGTHPPGTPNTAYSLSSIALIQWISVSMESLMEMRGPKGARHHQVGAPDHLLYISYYLYTYKPST